LNREQAAPDGVDAGVGRVAVARVADGERRHWAAGHPDRQPALQPGVGGGALELVSAPARRPATAVAERQRTLRETMPAPVKGLNFAEQSSAVLFDYQVIRDLVRYVLR